MVLLASLPEGPSRAESDDAYPSGGVVSTPMALLRADGTRPSDLPFGIEATEIARGLYQGSAPSPGPSMQRAGIDVVVLSAREHQLYPGAFGPKVEIIAVPLDDSRPNAFDIVDAHRAAAVVAARLRAGKRVLVTCFMGRNRSGWISGLALVNLGLSPRSAIERVRRRPNALHNQYFLNDILAQRG
jgi:hypothetical protein